MPHDDAAPASSTIPPRSFWRALGPALIVASVVLGPGSILTSSRVGAKHGSSMGWVLVAAGLLMFGMTALAARLGVLLPGSIGDELAARLGRAWSVLFGLCGFLVCACFQSSNNLGVLAAIEPLVASPGESVSPGLAIALLLGLNLLIVAVLWGARRIYRPLERLMMVLVGLMLLGFAGNLILAGPNLADVASGLIPRRDTSGALDLLALLALVGTTYSVFGAAYQTYLVREKGWSASHLPQAMVDAAAGITVLAGISLMIMTTSAAVLAGRDPPVELKSLTDVARQLEPLFGQGAVALFCTGVFAAAFSSFLINAMIGGVFLSDGLGLGARFDGVGPKALTTLALAVGMVVAVIARGTSNDSVNLIVLAQAMTVLGLPAAAMVLLFLGWCVVRERRGTIPWWLGVLASLGLAAALVLAARTLWALIS